LFCIKKIIDAELVQRNLVESREEYNFIHKLPFTLDKYIQYGNTIFASH
jgi:hypothetical protein